MRSAVEISQITANYCGIE